MKANKSLLFTLLLSIPFLFGSCSDKDDETQGGAKDTEDQSINEWIYDEMSFRYFWNDKIPSKSNLNFRTEPDIFFYSMLYKYKKADGDRFSILEKDGIPYFKDVALGNKPKHDIGFEFQAYEHDNNIITFVVTYVKNGTRAQAQGLKRGDWIEQVDDTKITTANYSSILDRGKPSYKIKIENQEKPLVIETMSSYAENPILLERILEVGDKRVGYIVYNAFANDADDNSMSYALEMNSIFKSYEGKIDELILDLRYNGGGLVESGNYIASAIVPNRKGTGTTIYTKRKFNNQYDEYLRKNLSSNEYEERVTEFFHDNISKGRSKEDIPHLNMKKLYVITSRYTASASEQIINGLRAYIPVEVIGETTTGKNMESYPISDDKNKENKWILHALTSMSYNSKGESNYSQGFKTTKPSQGVEISEFTFYRDNTGNIIPNPIYELGDPKEQLLSVVLDNIRGSQRAKRSISQPVNAVSRTQIGSSLDRKAKLMIIENQEVKQE